MSQPRPFPRRALLACLGLALAALAAPPAHAADGFLDAARKHFRVEAAPSSPTVAPGGTLDAVVSFDVDEGIHVYADAERLRFEWDETQGAVFVERIVPPTRSIPDILNEGETVAVLEGAFEVRARFRVAAAAGETVRVRGRIHYQGCTDQVCYPPLDSPVAVTAKVEGPAAGTEGEAAAPEPPAARPAATEEERIAQRSFLLNILWAFAAGIVVSFTPCVLPIIPITISVLGQRREGSRSAVVVAAVVYVLGLALTYAVVGLLVARLGNIVRAYLASTWFLVPLAALFVVLALSMFDIITLQVPQRVGERLKRLVGLAGREASAGLAGVAFMGVVAGIVAGPCVAGPLAAVLGYVAKRGDVWLGFWMLFALGWGMGAVLIAAGVSPRLLPKAGGWMVGVKHLLGFVMLWAAAYFLAPVVISSAAYRLVTAGLLIAAPVFLGCFDALGAESGFGHRLRRVLGLLATLYGIWLGATTLAELEGRSRTGRAPAPAAGPAIFPLATPEEVDAALRSGKPVIVDLTADWCVYCKRIEREVFPEPRAVAAARPFVTLRVDVGLGGHPRFADRYGVQPPRFLFFGPQGERIALPAIQAIDYKSLTADGFAEILDTVLQHIREQRS